MVVKHSGNDGHVEGNSFLVLLLTKLPILILSFLIYSCYCIVLNRTISLLAGLGEGRTMSGLAGLGEKGTAGVINSVGNLHVGSESINGLIANMTLISFFMNLFRENIVKGRTSFDEDYDYIIIGGGTAGCVIASRLSQHPCVKVLLLEAGGEQPVLTEVPGFARAFLGTEIDWSYFTAPQKYCCFNQKENRVLWNSGKVLGGGSTINAMVYARGNKENFNQWAREGAEGWSYDEVMPYFLKLEDNRNIDEMDPDYHRQGGPMGAEKSKYYSPVRIHITEAMRELGYPFNDINGHTPFGVYDLQGTVRNQERCSTAKAYLKPASDRENLHIVTNAFVRKILISRRQGNRAYGVVFEHDDKIRIVKIKQSDYIRGGFGEVIVANGATRTPQLLMLSGIGPEEHLEEFGIPVISNLPAVGKNLMDHYAAGLLYEIDPLLRNAILQQVTPDSFAQYLFLRRGPQTSICQIQLLAFLDGVNNTNPKYAFPQQQLYYLDYHTEDAVRTFNLKEDVEAKVYNPYDLSPVFFCFAQLLQPHSRGEILLNSIDPHEYPHINPNYYQDPRDLQNVVEGMKICLQAATHPAMQKIKTKWVKPQREGYPGCESFEGNDDAYLACIARSVVLTIWHPTGTARMGHPNDPRSVVDPQLRVIGVRHLRVINAAVMPIITSGNTNVPTMMIAEKAYDMMKGAIGCKSEFTIHGTEQVPDDGW